MSFFFEKEDRRCISQQRGKSNAEWGELAEELAVAYLIEHGMPVTARRERVTSRLEIDIISQQGDEMVFIEVKARGFNSEDPDSAIDRDKIKRIVRAADIYLSRLEHPFFARFDVVLIEGTLSDHTLTYIKDAFYPPLIGSGR